MGWRWSSVQPSWCVELHDGDGWLSLMTQDFIFEYVILSAVFEEKWSSSYFSHDMLKLEQQALIIVVLLRSNARVSLLLLIYYFFEEHNGSFMYFI